MDQQQCVAFLKWCLPRLGLCWSGYRQVRRTICKRLRRRMRELSLYDVASYRDLVERSSHERDRLQALCRVPLSRFYRDQAVWECLGDSVLPELAQAAAARPDRTVRCWSAGCACGQEPYTLRIVWTFLASRAVAGVDLTVLATDADAGLLVRAREGCYRRSTLKEVPQEVFEAAFHPSTDRFCVRPALRMGVTFLLSDLRQAAPAGPFSLILCRNSAFTYFDHGHQLAMLRRLAAELTPNGFLVLGAKEGLPAGATGFEAIRPGLQVFRTVAGGHDVG